jgi:hypothetical protein
MELGFAMSRHRGVSLRCAVAAAHDVAFLLAVIGVHFHPMINHRSVIDYRWHRPVIVHAL